MGAGTFETGGGGGAASGAASGAGAAVSMGAGGGGGASDEPFDVGAPAAASKRASAAPAEYGSIAVPLRDFGHSLAFKFFIPM